MKKCKLNKSHGSRLVLTKIDAKLKFPQSIQIQLCVIAVSVGVYFREKILCFSLMISICDALCDLVLVTI